MSPKLYSNINSLAESDDEPVTERIPEPEPTTVAKSTEPKPKKPRTVKQIASLEKARKVLQETRKDKNPTLDLPNGNNSNINKTVDAPDDAEPPLWFKKFVQSKVELKMLGLQKNRDRKIKNEIEKEIVKNTIPEPLEISVPPLVDRKRVIPEPGPPPKPLQPVFKPKPQNPMLRTGRSVGMTSIFGRSR
jgi:hypothetical protein